MEYELTLKIDDLTDFFDQDIFEEPTLGVWEDLAELVEIEADE